MLPRRSDAEMGSPTRYILRRNAASVMKDLMKYYEKYNDKTKLNVVFNKFYFSRNFVIVKNVCMQLIQAAVRKYETH